MPSPVIPAFDLARMVIEDLREMQREDRNAVIDDLAFFAKFAAHRPGPCRDLHRFWTTVRAIFELQDANPDALPGECTWYDLRQLERQTGIYLAATGITDIETLMLSGTFERADYDEG
jgi:hypothetical protein